MKGDLVRGKVAPCRAPEPESFGPDLVFDFDSLWAARGPLRLWDGSERGQARGEGQGVKGVALRNVMRQGTAEGRMARVRR